MTDRPVLPEPLPDPTFRDVEKKEPPYRITKWSSPWLILIPFLVGWEMLMIQQGRAGGPLSHVVWAIYGPRYELRWWLIGMPTSGFLVWTIWHFLFVWPAVPQLLTLVTVGLLVGIVGALVMA